MSLMPGAEYESNCLRPFRRRNSIAAKSRFSTAKFFSNSVLLPRQLGPSYAVQGRLSRPTL